MCNLVDSDRPGKLTVGCRLLPATVPCFPARNERPRLASTCSDRLERRTCIYPRIERVPGGLLVDLVVVGRRNKTDTTRRHRKNRISQP